MLYNGLFEKLKPNYLYENSKTGEIVLVESKTKDRIDIEYIGSRTLRGSWDREYCTSMELSGIFLREIGQGPIEKYPEFLI
jgi:hypothetical protein